MDLKGTNLYDKINEINGIIRRQDPKLSEAEKAFEIINELSSTIIKQQKQIQELKEKIDSLKDNN